MSAFSPQSSSASALPRQQPIARIIGLTGGIGMGKTTVANYLATAHRLPVLDADIYAREAVSVGSQLLADIASRYGSSVLFPNGALDRTRLGEIVFSNSSELLWLEKQIHPFVRDRIETDLSNLDPSQYPVVVLVIPLLFEARMTDLVNEIWVVYCDRDTQINRLQVRSATTQDNQPSNPLTLDQIHARINSQMPIEEKMRRADHLIENNTTLEQLYEQIDKALQHPKPG